MAIFQKYLDVTQMWFPCFTQISIFERVAGFAVSFTSLLCYDPLFASVALLSRIIFEYGLWHPSHRRVAYLHSPPKPRSNLTISGDTFCDSSPSDSEGVRERETCERGER
jgi:hypothetical protein